MDDVGTVDRIWIAFLGTGVMLVYPLYASMRAIKDPSTQNGKKWLTYWILYSYLTLFEISCWTILQRVILWPYMKLIFCLWLSFKGAAYIYENLVRRYTKFRSYVGRNLQEDERRVLQILDARKSIERFIEKYGPEAYDRAVLEAATKAN